MIIFTLVDTFWHVWLEKERGMNGGFSAVIDVDFEVRGAYDTTSRALSPR